MLQQTTVAAVIPYFERFISQFPTVHELANASENDVLRLWEGLGYYSRARNLHKAAIQIVDLFGGHFPNDVRILQTLPGIGRYTAGAIASFAFQLPAAIVEANTLRLYSRLIGLELDPRSTGGQKALWEFAEWLVLGNESISGINAGDFNQALMDIGSVICRPVEPDCPACPLSVFCEARARNLQQSIPLPKKRIEISQVTEASIALFHKTRVLLRKRSDAERWAGLWDFVRFEVNEKDARQLSIPSRKHVGQQKSVSKSPRRQSGYLQSLLAFETAEPYLQTLPEAWTHHLHSETGVYVRNAEAVTEIRHSVTRFRIRLLCFRAQVIYPPEPALNNYQWFELEELFSLPLSRTGRQFFELLQGSRIFASDDADETGVSRNP